MEIWFRKIARIALVSIFLVVIAGSVVRMTGSGMGCPDWPKCFGYIIPPTDESQVLWEPNHEFLKGQMIVKDNALWAATRDFTSSQEIEWSNWQKYNKHDYAIFNVYHTWTEYINRLVGAFSGLPVLLMLVLSFTFWKKDKILVFASVGTLLLLGFEAWLGKVVVDGNLVPGQITIHMFGALLIILLIIFSIRRSSQKERQMVPTKMYTLVIALAVLSAFQIFLGTNVREEVDYLVKSGVLKSDLIENISVIFKIHRSYSIILVLLMAYLTWKWQKAGLSLAYLKPLLWVVGTEIVFGIVLTYFGFPLLAQPVHLLLGFIMMGLWFNLILQLKSTRKIELSEKGLV